MIQKHFIRKFTHVRLGSLAMICIHYSGCVLSEVRAELKEQFVYLKEFSAR